MGSHMRCTKMNKNAAKLTKMDQNGHQIMTGQKSFEFVLSDSYDLFWIKLTLERG